NDHKNALPLGFQLHEYRIDAVLGAGGFGITYLAQDLHLNKPVVIKEYLPTDLAVREASVTVAPKSTRDQDAYQWGLERFMAEAQTLAQFKHPNIVQVFRYFTAHGTAYIVMDYEQGESLSAYLDRLQRPLNEAEALSIFLPVLDGVRAVHQAEFLHRDIKPDNIFLRTNSTPILIDFGAARMALGERSRSLSVVVSAGFAPFEQYSSQGRQGPWTDIYALGATLYRAITGNAPPEATERSMALTEDEPDPYQPLSGRLESQSYSPAFLAAIDQALEFRGKDRPQTVREFQYLLQGKISQSPTNQPEAAESRPKTANTTPVANTSPTSKRFTGTLLMCVILGLIVLGIGWIKQMEEEKTQQQAQAERLAEKKRIQQETKLRAEAERKADEKRKLEEAKRKTETERLAEKKRKQQEASLRAEAERLADEKRKLEKAKRQAEAERMAKEKRKQQGAKLRAGTENIADENRKTQECSMYKYVDPNGKVYYYDSQRTPEYKCFIRRGNHNADLDRFSRQ
ncbi:MAG: protein kinase, partial [Gammaproteobacteria bacterium]|nr:protein kinase [Gammaproteobacteria bacterium]